MKKGILPAIIISAIVVVYLMVYLYLLVTETFGMGMILGIIPIALAIMMIRTCIERIEEINGGESDDLSQY